MRALMTSHLRKFRHALLALALSLSACHQSPDPNGDGTAPAPEREDASTAITPPSAPPAADDHSQDRADFEKAMEVARKENLRLFNEFRNLKIGMTEQDVLNLLGKPSRREKNKWRYIIGPGGERIDEAIRIQGYEVIFEDGRVKSSNKDGDHVSLGRPDED